MQKVGMAKSIPIPSKNRFFDSLESIIDSGKSIPRIDALSKLTSIPITELRENKCLLS